VDVAVLVAGAGTAGADAVVLVAVAMAATAAAEAAAKAVRRPATQPPQPTVVKLRIGQHANRATEAVDVPAVAAKVPRLRPLPSRPLPSRYCRVGLG
jgi:hypothetical protein